MDALSKKKIVRKPLHSWAGCIVEPHNASRQAIVQFWPNLVKDVMFMRARSPVARGQKTLQMHGFPIQTWGIFKVILRYESNFHFQEICRCGPFCVLMWIICHEWFPWRSRHSLRSQWQLIASLRALIYNKKFGEVFKKHWKTTYLLTSCLQRVQTYQ